MEHKAARPVALKTYTVQIGESESVIEVEEEPGITRLAAVSVLIIISTIFTFILTWKHYQNEILQFISR